MFHYKCVDKVRPDVDFQLSNGPVPAQKDCVSLPLQKMECSRHQAHNLLYLALLKRHQYQTLYSRPESQSRN
ncbi:hypothetical protein D3C87_1893210 [compost metagenome]